MPFKDYAELVEPLILPINGTQYAIPPLSVAAGVTLTEHLDPKSEIPPMPDEEFRRFMLGAAYDEMIANDAPAAAVNRAAMTALADFQAGRDVAETLWETGGDPKVIQERAARAALQDHKPAAKTRRAAATTTKRPATGSGTRTSRKS